MKIGNLEVYGVIYKITNKVNGKVYIGQTTNKKGIRGRYRIANKRTVIDGIYRWHMGLKGRFKKGFNAHLFYSIEKYDFDNFEVVEIFDFAFSKEELDIKEKMWISLYKATNSDYGYNNQMGGVGGRNNDESIQKSINTQIEKGYTRYVNQLEIPTLNIIRTFPSIASATKSLGLSRSAIKNILNQNYNSLTAGGYAWSYTDVLNKKYKDKDLNQVFNININKNEIDNEIIELYLKRHTYKEIKRILNISDSKIHDVLKENNIERVEPSFKHTALIKRKEVLRLYFEGRSNRTIREMTGYTKSVVEKAIEKYEKGIIDANGVYINKK